MEFKVGVEVGVVVEVKVRAQNYFFGVGGWLEKCFSVFTFVQMTHLYTNFVLGFSAGPHKTNLSLHI